MGEEDVQSVVCAVSGACGHKNDGEKCRQRLKVHLDHATPRHAAPRHATSHDTALQQHCTLHDCVQHCS